MDKLINEWPVVSVNRIHLGLMVASLMKISEGICRGELQQMDWFSFGRADLDVSVKYGCIDYSNRILLFYSVFAIADLFMYFRHHPFGLWLLNCVHHVFRVFLLATTVAGSAVCIWQTLAQIAYCLSCACLYMKIGLLVDEKRSMLFFRRFAKYTFYASIVLRLIGYVLAGYWNFLDTFRAYPVRSVALFSAYFLFDAAYLVFHCLPVPKDDSRKVTDGDEDSHTPSSSDTDAGTGTPQLSMHSSVLSDVFDRELFYPAGAGLVAPLRSVGFTPNLVTLLSGAVQLLGLYLLATPGHFRMLVLACVFVGYTLDCVDGQMARRCGLASELGAALDTGKDACVTLLYLVAIWRRCGPVPVGCLLAAAFATVARGGLESSALPFRVCYRIASLLPQPLRSAALGCHGGGFTVCLMLVILMAC